MSTSTFKLPPCGNDDDDDTRTLTAVQKRTQNNSFKKKKKATVDMLDCNVVFSVCSWGNGGSFSPLLRIIPARTGRRRKECVSTQVCLRAAQQLAFPVSQQQDFNGDESGSYLCSWTGASSMPKTQFWCLSQYYYSTLKRVKASDINSLAKMKITQEKRNFYYLIIIFFLRNLIIVLVVRVLKVSEVSAIL